MRFNNEDVEALLRPQAIAVIGARDGLRNIRWLLKNGYQGQIYPVNPKYSSVDGLKCYGSLLDVPGNVDAVVSLVRAEIVPEVLKQARARKVKIVSVYAAPVSLEGQPSLEEIIKNVTASKELRVIGPNALGVLNLKDRVTSGYSSALLVDDVEFKPGKVAIISASGGIGDSILIEMLHRGVGVSYLFHPGNEADFTISDFFSLAVEQPEVGVIALYLEGIRDVPGFVEASRRALELGKVVVALKVGKTEEGKRAAYGHTGAVMANDDVFNAFCRHYGIVRVEEISDLIDTVQMFASVWPHLPAKGKLAAVSASGGVTTLLAEAAGQNETPLAEFSEETATRLRQLLRFAQVNNPLDLTGQALADPKVLAQALQTVAADPGVAAVLYGIGLAVAGKVPTTVSEACREIKVTSRKPVAAVMVASSQYKRGYHLLEEAGIPLFRSSLSSAVLTMKKFIERSIDAEKLRALSERYTAWWQNNPPLLNFGTDEQLSNDWEVKRFLALHGLPVAKGERVENLQEALRVAGRIGYPVVMKILSKDIVHKTEAGAVRVNIKNEEELTEAYPAMLKNIQNSCPGASVEGILIEEYVEGTEAFVGFMVDDCFGPVVAVGTGGIYVEALKDLSWRLAPVFPEEALEMIGSLKALRVFLAGIRGTAEGDAGSLAEFISRFSEIGCRYTRFIKMLEVNPLKVLGKGKGVKIVDARATVKA